jgi:hypothetical protein
MSPKATRRENPCKTGLDNGAEKCNNDRLPGEVRPTCGEWRDAISRENLFSRGARNVTYTQVEWNILGEPERPEYDETPLGWVYFILDPNAAQIKIGYTSGRTIGRRLAQHSLRRKGLIVLGTLRGGRSLERALHSRFSGHRREGREWFSSEIAADVLWLIDGEKAPNVAA